MIIMEIQKKKEIKIFCKIGFKTNHAQIYIERFICFQLFSFNIIKTLIQLQSQLISIIKTFI